MSAKKHNLTLITGPRRYIRQAMHDLLIDFALQGPVRVLLGGNDFPVYTIAYDLAARTGEYYAILEEGIHLSRAETVYQMTELLKQTPGSATPTLVSDLLNSFMEDSLTAKEVNQLLFECILELQQLCKTAPVYVSSYESPIRPHLLMALSKAADVVQKPPPDPHAPERQRGMGFNGPH